MIGTTIWPPARGLLLNFEGKNPLKIFRKEHFFSLLPYGQGR
jgi:hypothetical protein